MENTTIEIARVILSKQVDVDEECLVDEFRTIAKSLLKNRAKYGNPAGEFLMRLTFILNE